ncbi:MAG: ATP-dependent helicase [Burkholderiaceae bacterium]
MKKSFFTPSQFAAISHVEGNLQLIACAGSGKTEVVAQRVVSLLKPIDQGGGGCTPANIVSFTFTEKAASELKERIHSRCEENFGQVNGLAEMYVGTIHGFCLELLKSEVPAFMKYEVLNEVQQVLFVDRNSRVSGLTQSTTLNGDSLRRYVDTSRYIEALGVLREDNPKSADKLLLNSVANQLSAYEQLLRSKGYLDYSSILKETVTQIKSNSELRERLASRIKHVIVDEYQDVNPIQESVVSELHMLGAGICVVGDDDQTIYQWRGSDVQNILDFSIRYPNVTQVRLEENFRSSEGVVAVSRDFIKKLLRRLPKEMKATEAQEFEQGDIVALSFDSPDNESVYIAQSCRNLHGSVIKDKGGDRGIAWSDMAILLRSVRNSGSSIMEALDSVGVPYVITGMDNLFQQAEAEAARQLFFFLAGRITKEQLSQAWTNANLGIKASVLTAAINKMHEVQQSMGSATGGQFKFYNLQRQFMSFLELIQIREEDVPKSRGEVVFYNLGKFSQAISDFESIHFHSKAVDKYDSFASFLEYHADKAYPEGWQENAFVSPDAVRIMTIHQSKGLQWPVVFIPQLVRNKFPAAGKGGRTIWHLLPEDAYANSIRYKGGEADERRLFYVAATRSQKYLHMTWAPTLGNSRAQAPSDFFHDVIASKYVKRRVQDYSTRKRLDPTPKSSVANVTLSFSDVKYFFECPYQFKLKVLYGFRSPLDEAMGYGKSLHDALAEVHSRALQGDIAKPNESLDLVQRHLRVPYAYESLRQQLSDAAQKVIEEYLLKNQQAFKQLEFSEKPIEIPLGDGVSVAGRIDLVRRLDTGEVTIVDLKSTDRAQSEAVTEKQLHIYALGYQELTGRQADYVEIYELDHQKQKKRSVDDDFISDVKKDVRNAAQALRQNKMPAQPSKKTCGQCDFCKLCTAANIN